MDDRFETKGDLIVQDHETGLLWQRGASPEPMVWKDGFGYVDRLNQGRYAGQDGWHYPTKEELATLILPEEDRHTGLFMSSLFESHRNCWTSSQAEHHRACYVDFYYGDVYVIEENYANYFVRAVLGARR